MSKKKNASAQPQIKFDAHNFRYHNAENKRMIHDSLSELGAGRSIVMDNQNELIAGNGVYEQAQKLGMPVRIIETDGTELIAVKRTDLATEDMKRKKLAAADNAISDHVEWNADEIRLSGLDDITLQALHIELPEIEDKEDNESQEDNFDEENETIETRCKPGDLWKLGNHRLLCGDSTKATDVARLMAGEQADLWLTDPPYNVAIENSKGMTIQNDNSSSAEFLQFLTDAFTAAEPAIRGGWRVLRVVRNQRAHQLRDRAKQSRTSSTTGADMEQKQFHSWQTGLPLEARTVSIRMERRCSALLLHHTQRSYRHAG